MTDVKDFVISHSDFILPDGLKHSAKGTSWEKKDHKYIEKGINTEGKTFYRYDKKTQTYTEVDAEDVIEDLEINSVAEALDYKEFVKKYGADMAPHQFLSKKRGIDYIDSKTPILYKQLIEDKIKHSDLDEDYLEHHGIAGQKWGVSNGPPYPLSSEKHASVVEKAGAAVSSAGNAIKKTVKAVEDKVAKNREVKAKEKLEAEKRKLKVEKLKASAAKVKAQREALKKQQQEEKKAVKEQKAADKQNAKAEKLAKAKADAIAKGDLAYISKNKKDFSDNEIAEAIARKSLLTKLDDLSGANKNSGNSNQNGNGNQSTAQKIDNYAKKPVADRANDMVNKVGKVINVGANVAKYAKSGLDAYNTIAEVSTALGHPMKTFKVPNAATTNFNTFFDKDGNLTKTVKTVKNGNNTKTETHDYTTQSSKTSTGESSKASTGESSKASTGESAKTSTSNNKVHQEPGVEGTVKNNANTSTSRSSTVIDGEWREVASSPSTQSSVNTFLTSSNQLLLEDFTKRK